MGATKFLQLCMYSVYICSCQLLYIFLLMCSIHFDTTHLLFRYMLLPDVGIWCNSIVCGFHTQHVLHHDIPLVSALFVPPLHSYYFLGILFFSILSKTIKHEFALNVSKLPFLLDAPTCFTYLLQLPLP